MEAQADQVEAAVASSDQEGRRQGPVSPDQLLLPQDHLSCITNNRELNLNNRLLLGLQCSEAVVA